MPRMADSIRGALHVAGFDGDFGVQAERSICDPTGEALGARPKYRPQSLRFI